MAFQDKDFCQKLMRILTLDEGDTNRPVKKLACQKLAVIFGLLFKCDLKFSVFHIQLTDHLEFQHFQPGVTV